MFKRFVTLAIYVLAIILLGCMAGAICWLFFFLMNAGIDLIWNAVPDLLGGDIWWWPLPVCIAGGVAVGLFQRRWPGQPQEMNEVLAVVKKTGRYEYKTIFVGFFGALLPLLFGASIGPEAGLTGVIAGLCTWVGDRLRFLGREFRELASIGISAVVSAMFDAPLYGLAVPVLGDGESIADAPVLIPKPAKIAVYVCAVVSALVAMMALGALFGGMAGLPHFSDINIGYAEWMWVVPLALAGAIVGWIFHLGSAVSDRLSDLVGDRPVIKAVIAGCVLGVFGCLLPFTMFAGELQTEELSEIWMDVGVLTLIATALLKPIILQMCLACGWRGGKFFPMIFSGISIGYGMAALTGIDPVFCLCVCSSAALGAMMRQPLMAVLLLFMCFPVRGVIPMFIAALIGSVIPVPKSWLDGADRKRVRK